ncbi:hypothetical protein L211DRAFT_845963 [Terfezia boudieri ATCC MYA-4762]|uniref:Uncharacterized protein n=1 Tax=Terfezia boudieri ATCC MYA-4762 TaxID=1051890 RepID=A0A3N4LYK5_9PEZI|nr:hypothetical protein L211DRAFT_845963 [Terfezia boudieri ATCC MYA-4762]
MGFHTSDSVTLAAPKRERASRVSLSLVSSNHDAEAGFFNDPSQILPPLEPPPRIPVRSSLHQRASHSRINLGLFSSKRSSNNTSTPTPGSPSSTSAVTHSFHRTSWLSGTTSSLSLPHGQPHAEALSLAGSSGVSLSTAGGSSGGASSIPVGQKLPRRKVAVSDPFMFPLVAAPSPTHSVSVLSPALLEVPFSPSRAAPSPLSEVGRTHGDNISEIHGSESTTVHAIRAPRGMVENVRESPPPSVRSHNLWPASWGLSRIQRIFHSRERGRASSSACDPAFSFFPRYSTIRTVLAQPMGQRQASLMHSSPPHTPSRPLSVRRSPRNVRGKFGATYISPPLPQTSAPFHHQSGNNSFPPPIPVIRQRDGKDCGHNGMLTAVGELAQGSDRETENVVPETGKRTSAIANRPNHKGKGLGNAQGASREAIISTSAAPTSRLSIRQNSVVGYIYPCKYCTRTWFEECSCLATPDLTVVPAPEKDPGAEIGTRFPPQGAYPPSVLPLHSSPIPSRQNSLFAGGLEARGSADTGQVKTSQTQPRLPPAPLPQPPYASRSKPISSMGNRHGRRGGSDEFVKQGQGKFSWSNISLPIATRRPVSSSSSALGPPLTSSKRKPPPENTYRAVRSTQPSSTFPSPPSSPNAPSFVLSPAARDVLGIPSSTTIARSTRTASGQHRVDHQRQSSAASGSSSASQPGAPLRLWSSRPSSGSDAQGMVVVPSGALGLGRGKVSLKSVANATGVGVGAGEVEITGEEGMDPVKERDRMRRGLAALGLLNEEGVEVGAGTWGGGDGSVHAEGAMRVYHDRAVGRRGSGREVRRQGSNRGKGRPKGEFPEPLEPFLPLPPG